MAAQAAQATTADSSGGNNTTTHKHTRSGVHDSVPLHCQTKASTLLTPSTTTPTRSWCRIIRARPATNHCQSRHTENHQHLIASSIRHQTGSWTALHSTDSAHSSSGVLPSQFKPSRRQGRGQMATLGMRRETYWPNDSSKHSVYYSSSLYLPENCMHRLGCCTALISR